MAKNVRKNWRDWFKASFEIALSALRSVRYNCIDQEIAKHPRSVLLTCVVQHLVPAEPSTCRSYGNMNPIQRNQFSPVVISIALLICAAMWFAGAWLASSSLGELETAPILSLLIVLVMPATCFALCVVLLDTKIYTRFVLFTRFALVMALLPVTLGTFFSVWTVRELFGESFQNASMALKSFSVLAAFTLVAVAGTLIRRCIMNCLLCHFENGPNS